MSEYLGQLAFGQRIAGLGAQPACGYRGVIDGASLTYHLVTLPAGGGGWRPGDLSRGLPYRGWCVALAPAAELGAGGCGRGVAEVPGRRPGFCRPRRADEPDQQLIRADETDRRPGRDHRPDGSVGPALAMFAVSVAAIPRPSSQRASD